MNELTPAAVAQICEHMNEDHGDAVASYARRYANLNGVVAARMAAMDADGMDLDVDLDDRRIRTRIAFPSTVNDPVEARAVLIAMAREAASGEASES